VLYRTRVVFYLSRAVAQIRTTRRRKKKETSARKTQQQKKLRARVNKQYTRRVLMF
jgi:hypothetical protein